MKTKTVELSDGRQVVVGQLRWKEAKRVKQAIIDALAQDIEGLLPLLDQLRAGALPAPEAIAAVGRTLLSILESVNETFVAGCLQGATLTESLAYQDFLSLSTAAAELNDIEQLLTLEKNSPSGRAVMSLVSRLAPAAVPSSSVSGTPASKLDVFDPAGQPAT